MSRYPMEVISKAIEWNLEIMLYRGRHACTVEYIMFDRSRVSRSVAISEVCFLLHDSVY